MEEKNILKNIFKEKYYILDEKSKTQQEVFDRIAATAVAEKIIVSDNIEEAKVDIISNFYKREAEATTGFEGGFAIPHVRGLGVIKKTALIYVRCKNPINWQSLDKKPVHDVIALIVLNENNSHLELIASLARKLIEPELRKQLHNAVTFKQLQKILSEDKAAVVTTKVKKDAQLIVGITACPVGIAHTYMAADFLKREGEKIGYKVKIETHGASGVRNKLTDEDIKNAKFVMIASDVLVDTTRFKAKKVYKTSIKPVIKDAAKYVISATKYAKLESETEKQKGFSLRRGGQSLMTYLMTGVSFMVPVIIVGGISLAIALGLSKAIYGIHYDLSKHPHNFFYFLNGIGGSAFTLMIPVLGAGIAYGVAGRSAIAPALVASLVANTPTLFYSFTSSPATTPTGFLGAILAGLGCGYACKWINTWKVPNAIQPIMPIIVIPCLVGLFFSFVFIYLIGAPIGFVTNKFEHWMKGVWGNTHSALGVGVTLCLGGLLGAMIGTDLGGPINKVAFLTSVALLTDGIYGPMGAIACAIPVPPLGAALTTFFLRKHFTKEEHSLGYAAFFMGLIGITEGGIPFAVRDPKRFMPAAIIGSLIAGAIGGLAQIADIVAQGGPIIFILGAGGRQILGSTNPDQIGYAYFQWAALAILIIFIGAFVTCGIYSIGIWHKEGVSIIKKFHNLKNETKSLFHKFSFSEKIVKNKKKTVLDINKKSDKIAKLTLEQFKMMRQHLILKKVAFRQ